MINTRNIYDELGWEEAPGYQVGTRVKTLRDEDGFKTILLKFPKGFHMDSHTHIYNEQHIVLEGEYEIDGVVYGSGTYRFIPAHKNHGPFNSKTGAIVLVIWDKLK
ncbi:MAG: cupin domain-containing protein [Melioribacteraceae bacterium]|nr:cupin domain-containing protein [Melioribacteraceae bacterium]